jgi:hypothetical protein
MEYYAYDKNGIYVATIPVPESVEEGFVLEPYTTLIPPPEHKEGYTRVFENGTWKSLIIPEQPNPFSILVDGEWVESPTLKEEYESIIKEQEKANARAVRDTLLQEASWRRDRHMDEQTLGLEPTAPLLPILEYIQALRDITKQPGFPTDIQWPEVPV